MLCSDADMRKHAGGGNSMGFLQQQSPQGGRSHQQQVMDRQGAEDGVQGLVVRWRIINCSTTEPQLEWCWQVAKNCGFLPEFGPTWHSCALGRQAGVTRPGSQPTTTPSSGWGCAPLGKRFACHPTNSPGSSPGSKFWAAHQAPGMLSCCNHGTLSGMAWDCA